MRHLGLFATAMVVFVPASVRAAPGAMLVSESANGSVIDVAGGGDLSVAPRFATGLSMPRGLCVGPGGDIYVAESGGAQITIITDGGDFTEGEPFSFVSTGGYFPVSLACDDASIFVLDLQGIVLDITAGGDVRVNPILQSFGYGTSVSLLRDGTDVFVAAGDVFDVTAGGDFTGLPGYATGGGVGAIAGWDAMHLGASFVAPVIHDWTAGGALDETTVWATLPANVAGDNQVDGLLVAGDQLLAVSDNAVYDVTAGGDLTMAMPFAAGLLGDLVGYEGSVHHVCSADGDCEDADACNGAETCESNTCVPAAAPDCDDEDVCTADACDAKDGCTNEAIDGCCFEDADCSLEEICDVANNVCVEIGSGETTGSADETAGESDDGGIPGTEDDDGGPMTTTPDPTDAEGSSESSSGGAEQDAEASGCGCTADPTSPASWSWLALVVLARRGRRLTSTRPARREPESPEARVRRAGAAARSRSWS